MLAAAAVVFSPLGLLAAVAVLLVYLYYKLGYLPFQTFKRCGIKGPEPLPFLGNMREISRMGRLKYFEHLHEKYGPVSGYYTGKRAYVLVTDLDIIKQVFVKEFENFTDREPFPDLLRREAGQVRGILQASGEAWKTARQSVSPSFSSAKMRMMIPLIKKSTDTILEKFGEMADTGKSYDLFRVFGLYTMEVILAVAFGRVVNVQRGEADKLTEAAQTIFAGAQEKSPSSLRNLLPVLDYLPFLTPILRHFLSASNRGRMFSLMERTLINVVKARREGGETSKYKDLLQLMIDTTGEEELEGEQTIRGKVKRRPLTDQEIVAHSVTFVLAGYETTANTLSYVSYLLALNPEAQEKLQHEIDSYFEQNPDASLYSASQDIQYLDMVVQESLRLYPPAPLTSRFCKKEIVINGVTFPKSCIVQLPIKLIHSLPQYWTDPDKFDPERFTPEEKAKRPQYCHLPFSFGPRNCIGMRLALLEAKLAIIETMRKFSFVQAPDTEVPLQTAFGITMSPMNGVYLRIVARD